MTLRTIAWLGVWFAPAVAWATPCSDAFSSASELTQGGRFVEARAALIQCSSDECPAAMRPLCIDDLTKLEPRIPSIVVSVTQAGVDLIDVGVTLDGKRIAESLDGKAIDVNPGVHAFRVESHGASAEQSVLVREGEKGRALHFVLDPPQQPHTNQGATAGRATHDVAHRPLPWSVYFTSSIALISAGFWIGFGVSGLVQKGELDQCKGHCAPSAISSATTAFNVADVAAAITIAAVALDVILFATRPVVVAAAPTTNGAALFARIVY